MEFTSPFDSIFREKRAMRAEGGAGATRTRDPDVSRTTTISGKLGTGPNFSYPRPEGRQPSRHESSYSRSSVTSDNSLPGMTDSSDSDVSLDDDYCQYNASASELWDSFWPSGTDDDKTPSSQEEQGQGQDQLDANNTTQRPSRATQGYFTFDFLKHYTDDADDDTITITTPLEDKAEGAVAAVAAADTTMEAQWSRESAPSPPSLRSSPRRPSSKRCAATYSVYPKPQLLPPPRLLHPPRTSSLNSQPPPQPPPPPPPAPPQQQPPHALSTCPPHHSLPSTQPGGPIVTTTVTATATHAAATAKSVPVSPASPPPPPPRVLRPSVSAFNLRDRLLHITINNTATATATATAATSSNSIGGGSSGSQSCENVRHNATTPLSPLGVVCFQPQSTQQGPEPEPEPEQDQEQRFVSVFELDSDAESTAGNNGNSKDSSHGSSNSSGGSNNGANRFAKRLLLSSRSRSVHKKKSSGSGGGGGGGFARAKKRNGSSSGVLVPAIDTIAANAIAGTSSAPSSCFSSPTLPGGGFGEANNNNGKEKEMESQKGVKRSPSRKRGGSLGRILGLKSR